MVAKRDPTCFCQIHQAIRVDLVVRVDLAVRVDLNVRLDLTVQCLCQDSQESS